MFRSALLRAVFIGAATAALSFTPACSSDSSPPASAPSLPAVVYVGDATQAELELVLAAPGDSWPWAGGHFESPAAGAVLSAAEPSEFTWHADATDSGLAGAPDQPQMISLLVFASPSHANLLRVFTTSNSYTPDAATWQTLLDAREPITLSLTTATFEGAQLTADGGPHRGQKLTFTIE